MTWNRKVRRACATAVVGTLTFLPAVSAFALEAMPPFPPQPLANALESIARQAGLQLIYSSSLSNGVMSQGAPAGLSWKDALRTVLDGTGLTYQLVNEHTVTIIRAPHSEEPGSVVADPVQTELSTHSSAPWRDRLGSAQIEDPTLDPFVIITGTNISGAVPTGGKVITITRKDIDRSGYSTVQDVIRALPQNFGGGASEDTRTGFEGNMNTSRASGLNLRGLGAGSTLVLLNGRRLASTGSDGRFVDVSGIPLTAIERIEVLPDGASAIYGSDAVGGVVNFILRDDYEGAETQLKFGSVTTGSTRESQLAQLVGSHWDTGNALLSFEYYGRDRLETADRLQTQNSDLRSLGGDNFNTLYGNPGTLTDGIFIWAIPRAQDGGDLEAEDFIAGTRNSFNRNEGSDLLPQHKRLSLLGTFKQKLNERASVFLDAFISERRTEIHNVPYSQALMVTDSNAFYVHPAGGTDPLWVLYSFGKDFGPQLDQARVTMADTALGGTIQLGETWDITGYGMYSLGRDTTWSDGIVDQDALTLALADSNRDTAFNPFGDGSFTNPATLAGLRDELQGRRTAEVSGLNVMAKGTVMRLADRDIRIALGMDYRSQTLNTRFTQDAALLADHAASRTVRGLFGELLVPLIPEGTSYPFLKHAQLSLASRHERYSDFGGATTPKIGITLSPFEHFTLRGTWARSVKAPSLSDLDVSRNAALIDFQADPLSPGGSYILIWNGGNAELREETAETWSAGFDLAIPSHHLNISLGYFDIAFTNRIDKVEYTTAFLQDPVYTDIITRNPSPALREEICRNSILTGSINDCLNRDIAAVADIRLANLAVLKTSGIDLLVGHELQTRLGTLSSQLSATHLLDYSRGQFKDSPLTELLNTPDNPVDTRVRASFSWDYSGSGTTLFVNYMDGYMDTMSVPSRTIDSWTTFDVQARYGASPGDPRRFNGITLSLTVQNIIDTNPPFYNNAQGIGYDPSNADLLGRFVSMQIRKAW